MTGVRRLVVETIVAALVLAPAPAGKAAPGNGPRGAGGQHRVVP